METKKGEARDAMVRLNEVGSNEDSRVTSVLARIVTRYSMLSLLFHKTREVCM